MILAIAAITALYFIARPAPYVPPNLAGCSLAHGFVIGDTPDYPATVEIWKCAGQTVTTLNEVQGLPPNIRRQTRSHLEQEALPGEQLVGCRGQDENYDGTVALAAGPLAPTPQLVRAWKADIGKWQFIATPTWGLVCNRGLSVR